jgi:hypothetical protein
MNVIASALYKGAVQEAQVFRELGGSWIPAQKQIADRLSHPIGGAATAAVLLLIVEHMAALAKRLQVPRPIIGRIVVEMSGR